MTVGWCTKVHITISINLQLIARPSPRFLGELYNQIVCFDIFIGYYGISQIVVLMHIL